jgi:nitroimidazol reductase NimA-like FMN-containing flavoprotein (pyridoxamine 5'-phosphate oxidase superfamily)
MKQIFEIKDRTIINELLDSTEYGTLAVSYNDEPYAVPVNFVRIDDDIYFHGALSNKKMKILASNPKVSFSVVQNYSLIASFFSSTESLACPATQFFKSVSIDGVTKLVESREEKALVFEALMQKLQPEGGYKSFSDAEYDTAIKTTAVIKIVPSSLRCKFKFGQHVTKERFDMILSHLEERNAEIDKETVKMMKQLRVENAL